MESTAPFAYGEPLGAQPQRVGDVQRQIEMLAKAHEELGASVDMLEHMLSPILRNPNDTKNAKALEEVEKIPVTAISSSIQDARVRAERITRTVKAIQNRLEI